LKSRTSKNPGCELKKNHNLIFFSFINKLFFAGGVVNDEELLADNRNGIKMKSPGMNSPACVRAVPPRRPQAPKGLLKSQPTNKLVGFKSTKRRESES